MKKVLLLLSDGFEALEASAFTDVFGWNEVVGNKKIRLITSSISSPILATWPCTMIRRRGCPMALYREPIWCRITPIHLIQAQPLVLCFTREWPWTCPFITWKDGFWKRSWMVCSMKDTNSTSGTALVVKLIQSVPVSTSTGWKRAVKHSLRKWFF